MSLLFPFFIFPPPLCHSSHWSFHPWLHAPPLPPRPPPPLSPPLRDAPPRPAPPPAAVDDLLWLLQSGKASPLRTFKCLISPPLIGDSASLSHLFITLSLLSFHTLCAHLCCSAALVLFFPTRQVFQGCVFLCFMRSSRLLKLLISRLYSSLKKIVLILSTKRLHLKSEGGFVWMK